MKVNIPIFYGSLFIEFGNISECASKHGVELEGKFKSSAGLATRIKPDSYLLIVKTIAHEIIAHEALHITNFILHDRDIKIRTEDDELQAYLLGWIVEQCHKQLKKINFQKS